MPPSTRANSSCPVPAGSSGRASFAVAALLTVASPLFAQTSDIERRLESRLRRDAADSLLQTSEPLNLSLAELTTIDLGGFHNFTYLTLHDAQHNARSLLQNDTTLYARAAIDSTHSFFARARFRHQDFSPGDSFDDRGDRWREPFLDRYWYELTLRDLFAAAPSTATQTPDPARLDASLRVGRQFVDWGAGLALSEVLLSVRPTLVIAERLTIDAIAGVTPPDESIIDFDTSRNAYNRKTRRGYFGAMIRGHTDWGNAYASLLWSVDYNNDDAPRLPIGPVEFDYNPLYLILGLNATLSNDLLLETELVFQGGHAQSDPLRSSQTRESIRAFAARSELSYLFRDAGQSRAQLELLLASGDSDRLTPSDTVGGNLAGTDDNAFNSLGFANTGLAFGTTFSNLLVLRAGASTFPFRAHPDLSQFQVGIDLFAFAKLNEDAPIDEPTTARSFLGVEADFFINYRVTSDLGINLRYGAFAPGSAITGERDTRHFFLIGVTLAF